LIWIYTVIDNYCVLLKMADNANRKLRTRRPPQYLVGDVKHLLS